MGIFLVGLGFLVLVVGAQFADENGQVAVIWLALMYFLHTMGELVYLTCRTFYGDQIIGAASGSDDDGRLVFIERVCSVCGRLDCWPHGHSRPRCVE